MTFFSNSRDRLERAVGLAAVLDAAYEAFEGMRLKFRAHEDPASGMFATFVMAAAAAADGRDAVAFAPSLPSRWRHGAAAKPGRPEGDSAELIAGDAAGLSQLLAACLGLATGQAIDRGDRDACEQAASCAIEIFALLTGASR